MAIESVSRRVAQKELRLVFASPVAWLFLAAFAAITLFVFFWVESFFARNIADVRPLFDWMPLLLIFLSAALTMRMWSEERRTGTLEHVMTQPAGLWRFVLGKFSACFGLLLLALAGTLPVPITVDAISDLDWGPVGAAYLASALLGAAYLSIGLFVSARTDNPIVSLIGTVLLCGLLYLLGRGTLTDFFDDRVAAVLRMFSSSARFESITRGVIDLRDLVYYLSLTLFFLILNTYTLERERWAPDARTARQRRWQYTTLLLLLNLVALNVWLHPMKQLRVDVTKGQMYSISQVTEEAVQQLSEPLLIRGYFSAKTHPLLSPLVPQLHDLLEEYVVAGRGNIRLEWIDPAQRPELEQEANQRFGIQATPFQIADRYQSALVNAYFSLLVQYGDEYQTLSFRDLVEIRAAVSHAGTSAPEVRLSNPEADITQAIRKVLRQYRSGGDVWDEINSPLELIVYVSADDRLPPALREYREAIADHLDSVIAASSGKFSVRFIDPESDQGDVARQIEEQWGFTPMVSPRQGAKPFYFYLTLANRRQVVQLPTAPFDSQSFPQTLQAGIKRFAEGLTRTIALAVPQVHPDMARFNLGGPTFARLERAVSSDYNLVMEELGDGSVTPEADILAVLAPHRLPSVALFAIDQFLMRGGTVVLATSPYTIELADGELRLQNWDSGLTAWLQHQGISIAENLVLDRRNAVIPAPVDRQTGGYAFRDMQMIDYPYFIDIRKDGIAAGHPATEGLSQVTMVWASPLQLQPMPRERSITVLLKSSAESWLSADTDIMPRVDSDGEADFTPSGPMKPEPLAAVIEGRFESWFSDRGRPELPAAETENASAVTMAPLVRRSAESARLVVFGSNDFLDDQMLATTANASGSQYLGAVELFTNILDWALLDEESLRIRSRGNADRTLPPLDRRSQKTLEYLNYMVAIGWLMLLALIYALAKKLRRRRYTRGLQL